MQRLRARVLPAPGIAPEHSRAHLFRDRARAPACAEEAADDAGVRVGVAAAGERLRERFAVRGTGRQMAERVGERDAHEAVLRGVGDAHARARVVEPLPNLFAAVLADPTSCELTRARD